ncbi:MAG: hypothetical protein K6B17_09130 [Treponema sp.]|jgi:hypothetical protein|nr:hypothetical protein [Treponema sp.]
MLVVSYADFYSNPALYKDKAENYGLKILPRKKEKLKSSKTLKFMDIIEKATGIIPANIDINEAKSEAILKV